MTHPWNKNKLIVAKSGCLWAVYRYGHPIYGWYCDYESRNWLKVIEHIPIFIKRPLPL